MLSRSCLFRLQDFYYNPGDYLFDTFAVLFHFQFTSLQIREGIVSCFQTCLQNRDQDAFHSQRTDLHHAYLKDLHGVDNSQIYLKRMSFSACSDPFSPSFGLWGDVFCIKWLAKWLSIPINVWSLTKKTIYLRFNQHVLGYEYNILFHDHNPASRHYEPLYHEHGNQMEVQLCLCLLVLATEPCHQMMFLALSLYKMLYLQSGL